MENEPWVEDYAREKRWDDRLSSRPECSRCGRHISTDTFLEYEDVILCERCASYCTRSTEEAFAGW